MRPIDKIIIHCSATPEGRPVTIEEIKEWHTAPQPKGNNWSDIGYHYVIELDGKAKVGRPLWRVGAHCKGQNRKSIGICYVGGMKADMSKPKNTLNECQEQSLVTLLTMLQKQFKGATIHGHNEFSKKACPSFDVQEWLTKFDL